MKKLYIMLLLVTGFVSFAQTEQEEFNRMVEAEMKSAAAIQNFQVNPNTQNYDITYHELRFSVDPAVYFITGQVTTTFTALEDMNSITFDLDEALTVSNVIMNGSSLSFVQLSSKELVVTFQNTLVSGSSNTVEVIYAGVPPVNGFDSFVTSSHNNVPILWTLSEPFGARDWWPCKQDLNDKVDSIDVYITAPDAYASVANGLEQSVVDNGNGTKTTHFHHGYPIPAYLIAIAVTNYQVYTQTAGIGTTFPIVNYIYPENYVATQTQLAETLPIMNVYETLFEPYPFLNEKYGHAQFGWGGGMEHTTVSFMVSFGRNLIAHELAHQWFGDKITCGTWKDIWLNEGFAEYLSGLIVENLDGVSNFVSWKADKIVDITSYPTGAVYLTDAEATNVNRIFSGRLTYNKGAMVLHMLRWKMGDTLFFQALQNYLVDSNLAYAYAITPQLQSHLEAVYGSSLTEFFNDWIYNQGYPSYTIVAQNWGAGQAKITVNQSQSDASVTYFEMPLEIRLLGSGGEVQDVVVNNTYNGQEFVVAVPFVVSNVQFDPNYHIISKNNTATLGADSFTIDEVITLYPNPVQDVLTIKMPNSLLLQNVVIYNDLGQKVLESEQSEIDLTTLADGMYVVKLLTSEGEIHKKLIKK